jgi:DNA-binding transcriptional ArsR family regulator
MAGFEEETYSTVFSALKHPIRRKILRVLSKSSKSFTDMQNSLNINSPVLTYHLEALRDLISKTDDGKYRLSSTGEGATALMERVEEPPKTTPRTFASTRHRRILSLFQITTTILALTLLTSGWYLASVSSTQTSYSLPSESLSQKTPTSINGVVYDTSITTTVPPTEGLIANSVDLIFVRIKHPENVSKGIINITLRYVEYSLTEDRYVPKEENYTAGQFLPSETSDGLIFSGFISLPASIGLAKSEQPLPRDIVISVFTNTTDPNPASLLSIEAPFYQNLYVETQPYRNQGFLCTAAGLMILFAALMLSAFLAIDMQRNHSTK